LEYQKISDHKREELELNSKNSNLVNPEVKGIPSINGYGNEFVDYVNVWTQRPKESESFSRI
jgi:hypothetical protein